MWPFKRKKEVRAETTDPLLEAIIGRRTISKDIALGIPAVTSCIDIVAGIVQSLPIRLYKKENGKVVEIEDERTKLLNAENGDTLTPAQMWRAMIEDYYLDRAGGNAFIKFEGRKMTALKYIQSEKVGIIKNEDPIDKYYSVNVNGRIIQSYEMLRILRKTKDGATSRPITEEIQTFLSATYEEIKNEESSAKRGGNKKGFLQSEKTLATEEMDILRAAFRRLYTNDDEKVLVLNSGMKFQDASDTAREQQLHEQKSANMGEIYKMFHIAGTVLTGNAQPIDVENTIKFGIIPVLEDIEASINTVLLKESEKGKYFFRFDTKKLTRGNIKERYQAYELALKNHFLQIDEVREAEDLEALGIDFIELGLNTVLYDPKKGTVYTPNTNKQTDLTKGGKEIDQDGTES